MNKKIVSIIAISTFALAPLALFGSTFASWAVTDKADPFGLRITIDEHFKEPGHYLYWNGSSEGTKLTKEDLANNKYRYTISVDGTMIGNKTFTIKDQDDNIILNQNSALTIDFEGTYTLTTTDLGYDLTYPVYLTNNKGYTTPKAFCFDDERSYSDSWPGNEMTYVKDNEYNQAIYKIDVDAKKYAGSSACIIFSDNGNNQTVNVSLDGIVVGTRGYFISDTHGITLNLGEIGWAGDGAQIVAYHFGNDVTAKWEKLTLQDDGTYKGSYELESGYNDVTFIRYKPGYNLGSGSGTGWPGGTESGDNKDIWNKADCDTYTGGKWVEYTLSDWNSTNKTSEKYEVGYYIYL